MAAALRTCSVVDVTDADVRAYLTRTAASRSLYLALVATAALVNLAGYLLTLWHEDTVFDEVAHFYTSFAAVAAIGRLALENDWIRSTAWRWAALLTSGILLGLGWEAFEYVIGIIGSSHDTLMDLAMDLAGAILATLLINAIPVRCDSVA